MAVRIGDILGRIGDKGDYPLVDAHDVSYNSEENRPTNVEDALNDLYNKNISAISGVQSDWNETDNGKTSFILNKPDIIHVIKSEDIIEEKDEDFWTEENHVYINKLKLNNGDLFIFNADGLDKDYKEFILSNVGTGASYRIRLKNNYIYKYTSDDSGQDIAFVSSTHTPLKVECLLRDVTGNDDTYNLSTDNDIFFLKKIFDDGIGEGIALGFEITKELESKEIIAIIENNSDFDFTITLPNSENITTKNYSYRNKYYYVSGSTEYDIKYNIIIMGEDTITLSGGSIVEISFLITDEIEDISGDTNYKERTISIMYKAK